MDDITISPEMSEAGEIAVLEIGADLGGWSARELAEKVYLAMIKADMLANHRAYHFKNWRGAQGVTFVDRE